MGTYELHPRGAWALAADSLSVYARKVVPILAAGALLALPAVLAFVMGVPEEVLAILVPLYLLVTPLLLTALMIALASHHVLGVSAAPRQLLRRIQPLVLLRLVGAGLSWWLLVAVASLPGAALVGGLGRGVENIAVVYFAVTTIVIGGPVGWLLVRLLFVLPAAVIENAGPVRSVRRSFRLTRGAWWRLFGASLIALALWCGLVFTLGVLGTLLGLLPEVALVGAAFATAPLGMVFVVVLYYDARVRQEFLDVRELY